jgi:hypothetical protein
MDLVDIWRFEGVLTMFDVRDILFLILLGESTDIEEEKLLFVSL